VGELDGRITPRLEALHATIRDGFAPHAIMTDDIHSYLWGKLGYATLLFAQALGQLGIADCLARPELLPLWRALCSEVHAVAASIGVGQRGFNGFVPQAFAPDATEAQARYSVDAMVAFNRPNAKTHSGIWRDLAVRKRRTEVDVQVLAGRGDRGRTRRGLPEVPQIDRDDPRDRRRHAADDRREPAGAAAGVGIGDI
jgi:2-dehydropantoate 2-reductase